MFHRDGTLLARHPHVDPMIGQKFKGAPLLTKVLTEGGQQTQRVRSPVDHQDRLGSAAELNHFPIVVVATTTVSAALADWRAQTRFLVVTATLSALAVAFILFVIVRQMTRQNREAQQRLESEKHRLDTALNNMTQGLVLYDASARDRHLQPALHRYVQSVDRGGEAGVSLLRPDPASQGHRIVRRRCRGILFEHSAQRRRRENHPQRHAKRRRTLVPDRQQAAGAGRMGRHDRGHHGAPAPRTGTRPQFRIPAPDHRPHPDADHREGCARPPLCAGQPGGRDSIRPVARRHRRQDGRRPVPEGSGRYHRRGR